MKKQQEINGLIKRLTSRTGEERMNAVRAMGVLLIGKTASEALFKALRDKDELVRIETAEALGIIGDRHALPVLWNALNDRSPLVRRYSAIAIGNLGVKADAARLSMKYRQDRSSISRVGYLQALYVLGKRDALQRLLYLLEHRDYRIRCAAAHALECCSANSADAATAIESLRSRLKCESTIAARSSIRSSLRTIREGKN